MKKRKVNPLKKRINREKLMKKLEIALKKKKPQFFEKNVSAGSCLFYAEELLKKRPFFAMSLLGIALKKGVYKKSFKRIRYLALQHLALIKELILQRPKQKNQILEHAFNPVFFKVVQKIPSQTVLTELEQTSIFQNSIHEKEWRETIEKIKKKLKNA